jgi:hypothetical protein
MDSLTIREFKQSITNFIEQSDIPCEVKRLVIEEIAREVSAKANNEIIDEIKTRDEGVKENE